MYMQGFGDGGKAGRCDCGDAVIAAAARNCDMRTAAAIQEPRLVLFRAPPDRVAIPFVMSIAASHP